MAIIDLYLSRQSNGVFYLRVEDTDNKRFVGDAMKNMADAFDYFGIKFDEYPPLKNGGKGCGNYGPYIQSERVEIYHTFAKYLVGIGKAYPCFCTENDLEKIRSSQEKKKEKTGYYGQYAKCRDLSYNEIKTKIANGEKWVLRADFSRFDKNTRIKWEDGAKGKMSLPAEENDPIILKSNGVPPYNLAHIVDDTLMGTTAVVRGEEWLVSTAQHIQLFNLFGLPHPQYIHSPTINVEEDGKKRKLSKRKDKEALAMNLVKAGYPKDAIMEYLLTIYNTDFELWRIANPKMPRESFNFTLHRIGSNNPLFDICKLDDISKNILSQKNEQEIVTEFNAWYNANKPFDLDKDDKRRIQQMLCVERSGERPRKDLIKFGDIPMLYDYMFNNFAAGRQRNKTEKQILLQYVRVFDKDDDKDTWFVKIKKLAAECGYAVDKKEYKATPEKYKGTVGDFVKILRTAITGKENTPDLWSICQILGTELVQKRCIVTVS
jgi:glutamyl-tRNA synthetase